MVAASFGSSFDCCDYGVIIFGFVVADLDLFTFNLGAC